VKYDVCIVGAGIVGLSHAYWCSKKGLRVLVVDKDHSCLGASIRNFGLFWEIGQEKEFSDMVQLSKSVWNEFFTETNAWYKNSGALGLAYRDDEYEVIREYVNESHEQSHQLLSSKEVESLFPYVNACNLKGALLSKNEKTINSRETIPKIIEWLKDKYKVEFLNNTLIIGESLPIIFTNQGQINAEKLILTTGSDYEYLFPEVYKGENITKCKLQMLKTNPIVTRIEPTLFSATSFIHYNSFSICKSLEDLRKRIAKESPDIISDGINILIAQNNHNELLIGDSHIYSDAVSPFNSENIDNSILTGVHSLLKYEKLEIKERWTGVYTKSMDKKYLVKKISDNILIVNALAGAGMTLSFGLAKKTMEDFL